MSRIIDLLELQRVNERVPYLSDFVSYKELWQPNAAGNVYNLTLKLSKRVDFSDDAEEDGQLTREQIERSAKYSMAYEIFDEFRQPLLKLRTLALRRGDAESASIVEGILDSMFKV